MANKYSFKKQATEELKKLLATLDAQITAQENAAKCFDEVPEVLTLKIAELKEQKVAEQFDVGLLNALGALSEEEAATVSTIKEAMDGEIKAATEQYTAAVKAAGEARDAAISKAQSGVADAVLKLKAGKDAEFNFGEVPSGTKLEIGSITLHFGNGKVSVYGAQPAPAPVKKGRKAASTTPRGTVSDRVGQYINIFRTSGNVSRPKMDEMVRGEGHSNGGSVSNALRTAFVNHPTAFAGVSQYLTPYERGE
jgi:hypothetical protein